MKEYIKMSGRLLLYRFITTAKFNFLECMLHNTLTEFSIFQTQALQVSSTVFFSLTGGWYASGFFYVPVNFTFTSLAQSIFYDGNVGGK